MKPISKGQLPTLGFAATLQRELAIHRQVRATWLTPLVFLLIVVTLFAVGVAGQTARGVEQAPAILWVVTLLAVLLSLDALYRPDFDDGSLEQMLLAPGSIYLVQMAKLLVHWCAVALPLVLVSPLLALMLSLPTECLLAIAASIALGCGLLCFLGAIGAALTVSLRSNSLLVSLLVLPLCVPIVVIGTHVVESAVQGWPVLPGLAMLTGLMLLALLAAPAVVVAALRLNVEA